MHVLVIHVKTELLAKYKVMEQHMYVYALQAILELDAKSVYYFELNYLYNKQFYKKFS